jgi:hypothetical protein
MEKGIRSSRKRMGRFAVFEWLRSHKTVWLRALLFLLLWLTLLDFPRQINVRAIDPSWIRCLGHFLAKRYQCGVDYVWTFGPLGYLVNHLYDVDHFWWKYAWELSIKFVFAWLLMRWGSLLRRRSTRTAFFILAPLSLSGAVDALYLFCLVLLGLLPLRDENWRTPGRLTVTAVLLAVLSLTKFTFLMISTAVWAIVVLAPGLGWRCRAVMASGYPLGWAVVWLLLGQSLGHVPCFLASSAEITRGYGEAMSLQGSPDTVHAALTALALFLALLASYPLAQLRRRENFLSSVLLCASMFLAWKHGFIRQDDAHVPHFFTFLMLVPFAVEGLMGEAIPPGRLRAGLMMALVLIGWLYRMPPPDLDRWLTRLHFNGTVVQAPNQYKCLLDKQQGFLDLSWALPGIRQRVGGEPADLISTTQGVLLLNQLNYHPRPIFQSYSAYTPDLLERNAAFYRSEQAPAFVLCHLEPIDHRFPALEDGLLLLELFRRYRLAANEKEFLLLKRLADAGSTEPMEHPVLFQRTIAFGEEVRLDELGSMPKLLSVRIEDTLSGRLRKALFRPPYVFLNLKTQNDGASSYRLIPSMARCDFLLDPLLRDHTDLEALYTGQPLPRVCSFSIHVDPEARFFFQEHLELTISRAEELTALSAVQGK